MKRIFAALCSALLLTASLSGCSGSSSSYEGQNAASSTAMESPAATPRDYGMAAGDLNDATVIRGESAEKAAYDTAADAEMGGEPTGEQNVAMDTRKIVTTMNVTLQTTDFDAGSERISALATQFGGYMQDSYIEGGNMYEKYYSRSANYTLRIPADQLDAFMATVGEGYHIVNRQKSDTDISDNYYDSKARLDSLRIQEERLLDMLKQAAELEYLLQVEQKLADVRYQIDSMTSALNRMDNSVNLATVTVYLQEVVEYETQQTTPTTFAQRIGYAVDDSRGTFVEFCENALIALIIFFPFLVVLAIIALLILLLVRRSRKKRGPRKPSVPYPTAIYPMPHGQNPGQTPPEDDKTPPEK